MAAAAMLGFSKFQHFWVIAMCTWFFYILLCNLAIIGQCMQKWHRDIQCFYLHWKCLTTAPFWATFWGKTPLNFKNFKFATPKRHLLAPYASFERFCAKIGQSVWPRRDPEKKRKEKKVTLPVYNTTAWGRHRLSHRNHTLHFWLSPWRNHSYRIWKQSVKKCGLGWGLKFGVLASHRLTP